MLTIYHNPRCSKSRQTLSLLQDQGLEPEIVLYLETVPSPETLKRLLKKLNLSARQLLRRGEQEYKDQNLADTRIEVPAFRIAKAATTNDPLAAFCNLLADAERIVECSQHMDMLVAALFRQTPRCCSGGNNQPAELERVSVGQVDLLVGQTQP